MATLIICPMCETRYEIKAVFPPEGRKVRCSKCAHVWHALPVLREAQPITPAVTPPTPPPPRTPSPLPPSPQAAQQPRVPQPPRPAQVAPPPRVPQPDPPPPHAAARVAEAARPEFAGTPPGPVVDAEYDFEGDFPGQAGRVNADPPSVPPPPAEKRGLFAKLTGKRGKPAEAPRPVPAEMMPPPGGQADAVFTDASFTTGVDASYTPTGNAPYTPTAGASYTPTGDASFTPPEDKVDDATLADPAMVAAAFGETLPRKRERKGTSIVTIGWSVLGLIVAIVFGMLIFAPSTVVSMLPGTARLYSMFGAPIGMTGLAFEGVHYGWTNDGSQTVLEVQGNVRNVSSLTMTVPTVVIALRDEKGEEISEWTTEVGETELGAGEQAAFLRQIPSPPSNVRSLKVRFAKAD